MLRVLAHIQRHLDEELGLAELAAIACFSSYHFHRIFRGMLGEGVMEHVRRLRLERAAWRLKRSDRPVTQIALEAGYQSHQAFTRAFRSAFGTSPTGFRLGSAAIAHPSGVHYTETGEPDFLPAAADQDLVVRIERWEPHRVAFVRHVGSYDTCGDAWDHLLPRIGASGYLGADTRFIGLCWDDPEVTSPEHVRYDACVSVPAGFGPEGAIGVQVIAGGSYAVATHQGAWATLGRTYVALLGRWLPSSGRELSGEPGIEIYHTDPESTELEDMLTDVCVHLLTE
jgi:AraC family transcriptional regulator